MLKILLSKKPFLVFSFAFLLSQIGAGLTQVAVYGYLSHHELSEFLFTLTYALAVIPAFFASHLASKLAYRFSLFSLFTSTQILGALSVIIPIFGLLNENVYALQAAEFITAAIMGFNFPLTQTYIRRTFSDSEMIAAAKLDTYLFSVNVIIGLGIGSVIYNFVGPRLYLLIDAVTYLISAAMIVLSYKMHPEPMLKADILSGEESSSFFSNLLALRHLKDSERSIFMMLPALSILGAPIMSLLPAIGMKFGSEYDIGWGILITPSLILIFARSIGQFLGPMVVRQAWFEKSSKKLSLIFFCMAIYALFYALVELASNFFIAITLVIVAHIFSNIVYVIGMYLFQISFDESRILKYSSLQYQLQLVFMSIFPLIAGAIVVYTGFTLLVMIFYILAIAMILLPSFQVKAATSAL